MMMMHNESIYDIIPPKPVLQEKPPMYRSQHSGTQPPSASTFHTKGTTHPAVGNMAGNLTAKPVKDGSHSGFGKAKGSYNEDPNNYMKKGAKTGGKVLTLAEMKREHPETLAPRELKPSTRSMPKLSDQPVMNLVTSKNFVVANAVETILAAPKKLPEGAKDYIKKEDYGKVPKYLQHIKQDIEAEYQYIRQLQDERDQAEADRVRPLSDEERQNLLEGLKAKWEQVNTAYQAETHQTKLDTMGKMKRKEKNEATLMQIEKDIEKLSKRNIHVHSEM